MLSNTTMHLRRRQLAIVFAEDTQQPVDGER
jgi:hypothetical protein